MATDARGHKIPSGADFASRKSLTDLSLSIPSIKTCTSEAMENLHLSDLAAAGITPSAALPVYTRRTDLQGAGSGGVIRMHDGTGWRDITPRDSGWVDVTEKAGSSTNLKVKTVGGDLYLSGDIYGTNNQPIPNGNGVAKACVLPASHRPTKVRYLAITSWVAGGNPAYGRLLTMTVDTAGVVSLYNMSGNASSCGSCDVSFAR